ncbi:MAG: aminotransferase class I/II-fold pyridoxal phosphate-dependent enzyme [Proteobacteria bacterium]|nr:aminotransferase class I/II-fold pyridoxal phosphate-dependent enzyme [Pseudomonadota bacterium]
MRVIILGAGIAGLACALALRKRAGIDTVEVLERDTLQAHLDRAGHGLILMENGVRALRELGLERLLEHHTPLRRAVFQNEHGLALRSEALRNAYCVTRESLVRGLREALGDTHITFGEAATHIDLRNGRVEGVTLRTGQTRTRTDFDLLVGAEGHRSALCATLNPTLRRNQSQVFEIVTSTEAPALAERLGRLFVKTVFSHRGVAFGLLAPTKTRVIGFVQFDRNKYAAPPRDADTQQMRQFVSRLLGAAPPPPINAWLAVADFTSAHLWMPVDADLPDHIHCENAVVLGDAAHPMLPFTSQGVSAALEDAIMLADALAGNGLSARFEASRDAAMLAAALQGFEGERSTDVRAYIEGGRAILRNFVADDAALVPSYVDAAASGLEAHLTLPRGGVRALFSVLDRNGDNRLDRDEMRHALHVLDVGLGETECEAVFEAFDRNGDGAVTLDELIAGLGGCDDCAPAVEQVRRGLTPRRVQLHSMRSRARAWFRLLDEDGNGHVDAAELRRARLLLGVSDDAVLSGHPFDARAQLDEEAFVSAFLSASARMASEAETAPKTAVETRRAIREEDAGALFADDAVDRVRLRERAFNYRWAVHEPDVIPLTAADPDFPTPEVVRSAIASYLDGGYLSYGPTDGLPLFRESVSQRMRERGVPCTPETVLATDSAASGLFLVARHALPHPGDEAIIFDPVDFLFERSVRAAGGVVRRLPLTGGTIDTDALRALITPRTRLLGICSPHNPLGRVWSRAELEALATVACEHNLLILSDEVWSDIVFPPHQHIATASLDPEVARRTFTVYGFSKGFGMAGLRLGALVSPTPERHREIVDLSHANDTAYGVSTLSQIGGVAALREGDAWQGRFLEHLERMRDLAVTRLQRIDGVRCEAPQGTFVLFADVSRRMRSGEDEEALVERLRLHHRVAVVPGSPRFFGPLAAGHIRISFATSREILTEGLERLAQGLTDQQR